MNQIYLLLIILPRCFALPLYNEGCVAYPFKEEFYYHFSSLANKCEEKWKLGYYSSISLDSPHPLSTTFISPNNVLSCIISYKFPMIASGIVEVNLYMDPISIDDYISIGVYKVGIVSKNVVGEKTISPRSDDFKTGWETVKISLSGSGTFMGYILLKGKAADGSIVLIDSFRYIPPAYDEDLCSIYDGSMYINDFSTEFYDLTTAEQWTEQTNQESHNFNFKRPSDIIDTYTDKTNNNTTSITYPGIAMYMLDFTTEVLDATTSEQSTDIQIVTREAPYSYTTRTSDVREDTYLTDYSSQRFAQTDDINDDFPTTSQIISTETSTQQNDKDWDTSILPQDSTTMTPTTIESEIDASTLLVPTDSKNKIETITERNIATSLPERLSINSISTDITIHDEIDESISTEAIVMSNEVTTELGSSTVIEVNNLKRMTTEYANYVTAPWDFILDPEKSTVTKTEGTEYEETVTTTPKVSSTKHTIIKNRIERDKLRVDMLKTEAITTAGPYITTQQTEANVVTYAQTFKDFDNVLTAPNTTDLETSFKDETVVTNKTPKVQKGTTLQRDLQPLTTTVIPIVENNQRPVR
ncbi:uncharacterized protein LOC106709161 [Papilio machaon]|uniref:uncharacterized protein LOC106709161 n=1 Tax=Papilio machaon TaxID=76193 RepID=UPI001E6635BB|nr:uncharacterized protein LOC106709161 [Papilio machaon]